MFVHKHMKHMHFTPYKTYNALDDQLISVLALHDVLNQMKNPFKGPKIDAL